MRCNREGRRKEGKKGRRNTEFEKPHCFVGIILHKVVDVVWTCTTDIAMDLYQYTVTDPADSSYLTN